jgi:hypothetical protein
MRFFVCVLRGHYKAYSEYPFETIKKRPAMLTFRFFAGRTKKKFYSIRTEAKPKEKSFVYKKANEKSVPMEMNISVALPFCGNITKNVVVKKL